MVANVDGSNCISYSEVCLNLIEKQNNWNHVWLGGIKLQAFPNIILAICLILAVIY
jgi:hypothetical protein